MKEIKVKCKGSRSVPLNELINFQGNLKELQESEYIKLKNLILKYGFRFPVIVWNNKIIDGHSRVLVLKDLIKEGWQISDIPVADIEAKNEKEAKKALLDFNSRFGKITNDGLYEFAETAGLDFEEWKDDVDFAEIDIDYFNDSFYNDEINDIEENNDFSELVNFTIQCKNINQLEELKSKMSVGGSKMSYENFIERVEI